MSVVSIEATRIGDGRCFVIAEAGVNHNGRVDLAEALVDAAADAGADAVKFQTFDPQLLASPAAGKAYYQRVTTGDSGGQREMLASLTLPADAYPALKRRAEKRNVIFLSTPFDDQSLDFLVALGVGAIKIGSGDLTNHLLLARAAEKGIPLMLSTGMATVAEVDAAVAAISENGSPPLILLHCVSRYPAEAGECNLRVIPALKERFGVPVGWSDHAQGTEVSVAAVALGADVVEKHLTLDRSMAGPDHAASLEPAEFRALTLGIRDVSSALGNGIKAPTAGEMEMKVVARRALHAQHDLLAGHELARDDLIALRPGDGIAPDRVKQLLGRRLTRSVAAGERLDWSHFEH